jgi:ribose 5-phosphate isomerase B
MKVYLASDHAGITVKKAVSDFLLAKNYVVEDCGAYEFNKDDDYPDFIGKAAAAVSKDPENAKGIIFGGSGQGEAMVANKFKHVRCAVFYTPCIPSQAIDVTGKTSTDPYEMLRLTREHNDANILSVGIRFLKEEDILKAVSIFLEATFSGAERHKRRIEKIKKIEENK